MTLNKGCGRFPDNEEIFAEIRKRQSLKIVRVASSPEGRKPKLLDQVRQAIRMRHYSSKTEKTYVGWMKRFIFFHNKRHPVEMGEAEIAHFLSESCRRCPCQRLDPESGA